MSLLDVMASRALRGSADVRSLYAKLRRGLVTFSTAKVVLVAPKTSNGRHPAPEDVAVASASAAPAHLATSPNLEATAASAAAAAPPAPVAEPPTVRGTVVRRSGPLFAPANADGKPAFPVRSGSREGSIVIGDRGASGARLYEARRLNRIAVLGVTVGVLNLAGLIVAVVFAGSMLRTVASSVQSSAGTAKIDQRAWLGTGSVRLAQPYAKANVGLTFALENTGKTPASIDGIDETIVSVDSLSNRRTTIATRSLGSRSVAPGAEDALTVIEPRPLTAVAFAALTARHVRHEFAITIRYRDAFGDSHQTQTCRAIEGTAFEMEYGEALASCGPNSMD